MSDPIKLEESWKRVLLPEFEKSYMVDLRQFVNAEKQIGKIIFPKGKEYFNALDSTPFDKVKVVILGQDPYHGPGQAHGLCFSVQDGVRQPPSLKNIFKELNADLKIKPPSQGNLQAWAEQGVLLLNSVLTVESGKAGSHQKKGWETFTDQIIQSLNEQQEGLVFILWGSYAQAKGQFIDQSKHLVIKSSHPSPLSAHRGFLGSKPFSKANNYLISIGKEPINWALS